MYDEKLAQSILEKLGATFPDKLHLKELRSVMPEHESLPDADWFSAVDALRLEGKIDGQFLPGQTSIDDAAALYITELGRSQLRAQQSRGGGPSSHRIAGREVADVPQLPLKLQKAFESARAKADLEHLADAKAFPNVPLVAIFGEQVWIQKVFFAYCAQARNALGEGHWTPTRVRNAVDAAWPIVFDSCVDPEHPSASDAKKSEFRNSLWKTVVDDQRWKQHLTELAVLAEQAAVASSMENGPGQPDPIGANVESGTSAAEGDSTPSSSIPDKAISTATEAVGGADLKPLVPALDAVRIRKWMADEGYDVPTLALQLKKSERAVTSLLNGGDYHGRKVLGKVANLMGCDVSDLYQD